VQTHLANQPTQIYEFRHKILGHVLSGQTLLLFLFHLPAPPPYFIHTSKSGGAREREDITRRGDSGENKKTFIHAHSPRDKIHHFLPAPGDHKILQ
jgi:hypothetical protein